MLVHPIAQSLGVRMCDLEEEREFMYLPMRLIRIKQSINKDMH